LQYAVILAGGKGERFWPRSRKSLPKQLLNIVDDTTMVEKTIERISPIIPKERIFIVGNKAIEDGIRRISLGIPEENHLFEPQGKNTAPAIGFAAFTIRNIDKDAVMIVLPADHHIKDRRSFLSCVKKASRFAEKNYLLTFGIVPTRPETGYGYIESGPIISNDVYIVKKYKEKPSHKKANEFIRKGNFLWNCGIFVWRVDRIIEEFYRFQPEFAEDIEEYVKKNQTGKDEGKLERIYERTESISIDYAIMEKASNVAVIRASFGWDDVGSWSALERLKEKDEDGNTKAGNMVLMDTKNSILVSDSGVIAAVGVSNLVIIHTKDATLVIPKERIQEVKEIVRRLNKRKNLREYT